MTTWFTLPTKVVYGDRAVREIGPIASSATFCHAMIVTDSGVRRAGLADVVAESLHHAGVATTIYDRVSPNPRSVECSAGAEAMSKAGIDLVVAVGGGSAVDAAKAMALLVTNGGQVQDYIPSLGGQIVAQPMLPLYAVPTTCGTGAEVSPTAIITIA
ncbi:MAG: iron-containing alcohol dehydrogenase, partial [Anaerolineae bacterium]